MHGSKRKQRDEMGNQVHVSFGAHLKGVIQRLADKREGGRWQAAVAGYCSRARGLTAGGGWPPWMRRPEPPPRAYRF